MRAKKRFYCIAAVLLTLLADTSLIPFTGLGTAYIPRFCLLTVIIIGILAGKTQGIIYGTFAGLMLGYTVYTPAGITMLVYVICGLAGGFLGKHVNRFLVSAIPVAVPLLIYELVYAGYFFLQDGNLPTGLIVCAAIRIVTGLFAAQPMFFLSSKVLAPNGYAA